MKLFRNIRQKLINTGNLRRYLFYAIGEILLVMIGISLAFQVDNWNEDNRNKAAERAYYRNIRNQITGDRNMIQGEMNYNNHFLMQYSYANEIIEANDRSRQDTLGLIVRKLTSYSDFDKRGNIYETMVNSGEIKLLKNIDIVNGIRELEEIYVYMNRMENIHYDAMMNYAIGSMNPAVKMLDGSIKNPELIYNYEFQNLILALMAIMNEKNQVYTNAISKIDQVTEIIDTELSRSKGDD